MIRMSKLTDYAIVILAHLARSERTLTASELSERSKVPPPTVSKLCKELTRAGIVVSHRGRHGGYGLARPPDRISVAEVVEALEGPIALTECSSSGAERCGIEETCFARGTWDPVSRAIQDALQGLPLSAIGPFREATSDVVTLRAPVEKSTTVVPE
ncbi:MAG TPA: SUF system Fe-S cluster assembly regulator [Anaeromyxobacteraceae bacterium]|nr:SUF system Fe-S cluster assembly regulator [Anaeromyxobacteraceae bacterium]